MFRILIHHDDSFRRRLRPYPKPLTASLERLFTLLLYTGLRPREAASLSWDAIDLKDGKIRQAVIENKRLFLGDLKTKSDKRTISLGTKKKLYPYGFSFIDNPIIESNKETNTKQQIMLRRAN